MNSFFNKIFLLFLLCPFSHLMAQKVVKIKEVKVTAGKVYAKKTMPDIEGVQIFAGKKTDVINLDGGSANLAQNNVRTAFAKIPGVNVWTMDGAGTQVNIGTRGSNPHRSIEMNMRQNGYVTNSDIFGYPEDHYTPPLQGVKQVQLVRGASALQFGSQFGGMMNYVMKDGDTSQPFVLESEQTAGSNSFFNSYNAAGGTLGKFQYYAYYDDRHGDGWRDNARFNYHAYYASLRYHFNDKGSLAFQFSRMQYVQQIAGGLTDIQFKENPRQSNRARNFFNPEINIPALLFDYRLGKNTKLNVISHMLFGQRNSVQFINPPTVSDTFNMALKSYNPRQVDRDYYNAFSTEARLLHQYRLCHFTSDLSGGLRYSNEVTKRKQKGVGTAASDFDLSLTAPYGTDLRFHTINYAAFAENLFQLTDHFSITPGVRYEIIKSDLNGVINHATDPVTYIGKRIFPLFGVGAEYKIGSFSSLYANWSQAYHPYLYADITPADRIDVIDPNLKDGKGYDVDLGYRGNYKDILHFDINAYYLYYGDKVGLLTEQKPDNSTYLLTTNIGNAVSRGLEVYTEVALWRRSTEKGIIELNIFNSLSYDHARYASGMLRKNDQNVSLKGNWVEGTPEWIDRAGVTFNYQMLTTTVQYSHTGKSYGDANNTLFSADGSVGIVPAYHVWDWSLSYLFLHNFHLAGGINNLANLQYFTRRITFYPGPGILPADERTYYITLGMRI